MARPPVHPASTPILPLLAVLALIVGIAVGSAEDADPGISSREIATISAFACAVMLLGLYGLAWLLRGHELWREQRRGSGE